MVCDNFRNRYASGIRSCHVRHTISSEWCQSRGCLPLGRYIISVFPIILLGVLLGGLDLGGFFSALFSPESLLFNFLFAGTGAVFGLGFARIYRSEIPAKHSLERTGDSAREASEERNSASQNDV